VDLIGWLFSCLLLGLRVGPVFAFAPPFSLTRLPVQFRVLLGLAVAACIVSAHPVASHLADLSLGSVLVTAVRELFIGMVFVTAFQVMFAALYIAGRVVDIQAGFGLATLIDPVSQASTPLVGTLFAYAAAAVFFAIGGQGDLMRLIGASLEVVPLGQWRPPQTLEPLTALLSVLTLTSLGVAGGAILCLFLADLTIAVLARTAPQLNALMLGFQVKTLLLLLVLPVAFGASGALFARMAAVTLEAVPRLI
jgi:flagellar biosynthetic protein FliR